MAIRTLPTAPRRTDDPDTFIANTDAWLTAIPAWTDDANALASSMGVLAAGAAFAIPYKVDLGTTMADPTSGWLRFNSTTQSSATSMVIDVFGSDGVDYTAPIYTFDDSTSVVLGSIRIVKLADPTKFLVFNLTALSTPTGYRQLTITNVGYGGSTSPFAQGDLVVLLFQRTGDKGDMPPTTQFTPVDLGAGTNVNLALGNYFLKTISANTTLTFSAPPSPGYSFIIEVTLTSGVLTLPASVTTANNSALTLTAGKTHLLGFFTSTTGAKWRMSSSVNYTT